MSEQTVSEGLCGSAFWHDVTVYASSITDERFVDEMAYMIVTLYRTGA